MPSHYKITTIIFIPKRKTIASHRAFCAVVHKNLRFTWVPQAASKAKACGYTSDRNFPAYPPEKLDAERGVLKVLCRCKDKQQFSVSPNGTLMRAS
jgi:hypothetical protein